MGRPESYWKQLPAQLKSKRDRLVRILEATGMVPIIPEAGYFLIADYSALKGPFEKPDGGGDPKDYRFVRWLTKEKV